MGRPRRTTPPPSSYVKKTDYTMTLRDVARQLNTSVPTVAKEEDNAVYKLLTGLMQMEEICEAFDGCAARLIDSLSSQTSIPIQVLARAYLKAINKTPTYKRYWSH